MLFLRRDQVVKEGPLHSRLTNRFDVCRPRHSRWFCDGNRSGSGSPWYTD